jgi:hypothetical protein
MSPPRRISAAGQLQVDAGPADDAGDGLSVQRDQASGPPQQRLGRVVVQRRTVG